MSVNDKKIELNSFEKYLAYSILCGDYIVMGTVFIHDEKFNSKFDTALVKKALEILQYRHPLLNSSLEIIRKKNRAYLNIPEKQEIEKIDLVWLDFSQSPDLTREKLVKECSKFNSHLFTNLLWRTQVIYYIENGLNKYIINIALNEIISDGMSTCNLCIELVNVINSLQENRKCEEMRTKLELVGNIESLSSRLNLKEQKLSLKDHFVRFTKNLNKAKLILPDKFKSNEFGYISDFFYLNKIQTDKILSKSKLNKIKLTGYFHTVSLYAMRKLYVENNESFPAKVCVEFPVSLRIRYEPNLDFCNMGFHTSFAEFPTDEKLFGRFDNFWKDAVYMDSAIQESIKDQNSLYEIFNSKELDEFNQVFKHTSSNEEACKYITKEIYCDLALSNLGAFVNLRAKVDESRFKIEEFYCSDSMQSYPKISSAIIMHVLFWRDRIMLQIGANQAYFGSSFFNRYKQLILQVIDQSLE